MIIALEYFYKFKQTQFTQFLNFLEKQTVYFYL